MKTKDHEEYETRDRPAENGIRLNNALTAILILVSSAFGGLLLTILMGLASDVSEIKTDNSATRTDIINMKRNAEFQEKDYESHRLECMRLHESHDKRLREAEGKIQVLEAMAEGGYE